MRLYEFCRFILLLLFCSNSNLISDSLIYSVTAIGYKPTLDRNLQEENMCRYTCKSKKWYPKPEVIWMNYGGDTVYVEAKTNVTWSERDHFTVQSIITLPCENVDVVCVVKLIKSEISRSGRSHFYTCIFFPEGIRPLCYF